MLVKELARSIAIHTYIRVEAQDLTAPDPGVGVVGHEVLEAGSCPEVVREGGIVGLEAVVYADGVAVFGFIGGGDQGKGGEEGGVALAEG